MPKQIDNLKKERYKQARLEGHSIKGSMLKAGYTEATAHHSSTEGVVKRCEPELMAMVKASDISVDWVLNRLNTELKATDAKASDRVRILELFGKYLSMFKDTQAVNIGLFNGLSHEDIERLPKLSTESKPIIDITT